MKKKLFALASLVLSATMILSASCTPTPPSDNTPSGDTTQTPTTEHTHAAAATATWQSDATKHWKVCAEHADQKVEEANHSTANAEGKCPVCEYQINAVTPTSPTLWVLGDSTACDFSNDSSDKTKYYPRVGFGVHLGEYFNSEIVVKNIAWSGRSSLSYINDAQSKPKYEEYVAGVKQGDYVIIAFGHNDEKAEADKYSDPTGTTATAGSFKYNLYNYYMKVAADKGATPILATPIVRYDKSGAYADSSSFVHTWGGATGYTGGDYAQAIRDLATEKNVTLVDNTALTKQAWTTAGANAIKYHAQATKDAATVDGTHLNAYGAKLVAYMMANNLKAGNCSIKNYVKDGIAAPTEANDLKVNTAYVDAVYSAPTAWTSAYEPTAELALAIPGFHASAFGNIGGAIIDSTTGAVSGNFVVDSSPADVTLEVKGNKGKIASTDDGYLMYFKQIPANKDFTFSADMTVKSVDNNNQVGYGLVVRDDMYIDLNQGGITSNYVAVGGHRPSGGTASAAWKRESAAIKYETATTPSTAESKISLKIVKVGNTYSLYTKTASDDDFVKVVDYTIELNKVDADYVYAGLMACRNVKVYYENIVLNIAE